MPAAYRSQSMVTDLHPVTRADVVRAKQMMRDGGCSLNDAATALDVLAIDLDQHLMRWLGRSPESMMAPELRA